MRSVKPILRVQSVKPVKPVLRLQSGRARIRYMRCPVHKERCTLCNMVFASKSYARAQNQLKMHRLSHASEKPCPVCKGSKREKRFKREASTAQHLESGTCPGCPGEDNGRMLILEAICRFHSHLISPHIIENGVADGGVGGCMGCLPDKAYWCEHCNRTFDDYSAREQHAKDKHDDKDMT